MHHRKSVALVVSIFITTAFFGLPRARAMLLADPLMGKWTIKLEPDDEARKAGEKPSDDTLTFEGLKFISEAQKKLGFAPAEYREDVRPMGPATFTAELSSDKEGKAKWSGTVITNQIQGEMTWTKKDGKQLHYSFKGQKA